MSTMREPEPGAAGRPFGAARALLILLLYLALQLGVGLLTGIVVAIRMAMAGADPQDPATLERLQRALEAPAAALGLGVAALVVVPLVRSLAGDALADRSRLGVAWARGSAWALACGLSAGALLASGYLLVIALFPPASPFVPGPTTRLIAAPGPEKIYLMVAAVAVAPPLEELLFRGVLLAGFSRSFGAPAGAVLSTALFTAAHLPEIVAYRPSALAITLLGVLALVLRLRAAALGPAIAVHFAYNLVLLLTARALAR
jgi:membrane protease YdiL (CAAX protease family)